MSHAAEVVTALAAARRGVQLYPPTHPAFNESLDALVLAARMGSENSPLVMNWHNGHLYEESIVIPDEVHGASSIAEAFESRRLESLTFSSAFERQDALALIEVLTLKPSPDFDFQAELDARAVTTVSAAALEDDEDPEREERDRQREADRALYQRTLTALRRLRERFAAGGTGDLADANGLVENVMSRLVADPSAIMGLATMRGASEQDLFHSLNVMIYALALGRRLGLPEEGLQSLGMSALLHDVGKAAFDADDPAQAEPMRTMHPKVGADILQRAAIQDPAPLLVAYEHHMHADGGGWPERAADYVAHPYSRMVAVANRYDNLLSPRDGSEPMTPDKAVIQVVRESASILDPFFARLFANAMGVFPVGCLVRLSDQSVAVVSAVGEDPLAPIVRVAYDARGNELDDPAELDLASSEISILEVIAPESLDVAVAEKL